MGHTHPKVKLMTTTEYILGWAFYGFAVRYLADQTGVDPLPVIFAVAAVMLFALMMPVKIRR